MRRLALKPGQPSARSKLTDEVQQKICNAVSAGQTFECAAALAHIDRTTLNDWRQRGQQEADSRYGEFNRALEQALLASETMMVHKILSDPDWKAAKWILKNRFPDRYRDLTRAELSGLEGKAIPLEHSRQFTVNVTCKAIEEEQVDGEGDPAENYHGG
jgi:succinate dehydrogenase flavin-adding protein (antitoxin of CptAB toxin-antitoxin module)